MRSFKAVAVLVLSLMLSGPGASGQETKPERGQAQAKAGPRRGFGPPTVSPEVQSDGHVTFRLRAPAAKEVTVTGEWGGGPKAMEKNDQGIWSVTLGPLKPELYGYSFNVDGFQTLDPSNSAVKPMRSPRTSILEVPGTPPLLHEFQDVPHGTVHVHAYRSKTVKRVRGLYVYTPPGYDRDTSTKYPVLYLFHGAGDNEATWTALGRAHLIADNLLAQGKARPLLIVMPDGHAALPQAARGAPAPAGRSLGMEAFQRDLLGDVMPLVESSYRVRAGRDSRAIAGLSMGGGQSLTIGLGHSELFAYVAGFSSAVFNPENTLAKVLEDPKATNDRLRLLWIGCGKDDRLLTNNRQLSELLKSHQVRHEFVVSEGAHSWPVWRIYLGQVLPLLFTDAR